MEPFWKGLGEGFGSFLGDFGGFWGFEKESNFEPEAENRKSGLESRVKQGESTRGSSGPNIDH